MSSKYLFLFLFLLSVSFSIQNANCQTYVPFISATDSSDMWNDQIECWSSNGSCFNERTNAYKVEGDTIINTVVYGKVYLKEHYIAGTIMGSSCPEENVFSDYVYYGGIRENQKQIFLFVDQGPEYLVYDFNLIVGDTVPDPSNYSSNVQDRIISNIGQVQIDGVNRKSYELQSGTTIIEGIGSSNGLFNPLTQGTSCTFGLNCYSENGNTIHGDMNCNWNLDMESNVILNSFVLYPNPTKNQLFISLKQESQSVEYYDFKLYSLKGDLINSFIKKPLNTEFSINLSTLNAGVYFMHIISDSGTFYTQKIIKE